MGDMIIGYARVSTEDQNPQLQQDALEKAGCERVYTDVGCSGAKASRPELDRMLDALRDGDVVVVWRLDRLGRSVSNLVELVNGFDAKGVQFRSLTEGIDTTTPTGRLVFHIFASLAEFERDLIRERTMAGLKAARARGRKGGRPSVLEEALLEEIEAMYLKGGMTAPATAKRLGVSVSSVKRGVRRIRDNQEKEQEAGR